MLQWVCLPCFHLVPLVLVSDKYLPAASELWRWLFIPTPLPYFRAAHAVRNLIIFFSLVVLQCAVLETVPSLHAISCCLWWNQSVSPSAVGGGWAVPMCPASAGMAEQCPGAEQGWEAPAAAGLQGKHWVTYKPASQLARGLIRQAVEPCLGTEHAEPRMDPAQTPGDTTQYCSTDRELLLLPEPSSHWRCTLPGKYQELCWRWPLKSEILLCNC